MFHHNQARAGITVVVLATLVLFAVPLRAAASPAWEQCAVGEITDYAAGLDDSGNHQVSIAGWVRPCTPPPAPAGFEIVYYYSARAFLGWDGAPQMYASPTGPTPFTAVTTADPHRSLDGSFGPLRAMCLTDRAHNRVACVGIERDGQAPPVVSRIPTDDRRLRLVAMPPGDIVTCGSCV